MNKGMVFLVGAGPGDPGLLTLRGKELLETAEVLVYDRRASREFLELVPAGCEKIYVGKESGRHSRTQEEINGILVEWALKGKRVIRFEGRRSLCLWPGRRGDSEPLCPWDPL